MSNDALDAATARKIIRTILDAGRTYPTVHFKERLKDRNISMQDVIAALKSGIVTQTEHDLKTGDWKYTITGSGIDINPLNVVITIYPDQNKIVLLTVF